MRKVLGFQEFDPRAYAEKVDWRTIAMRWALIALVIIVPVALTILQWVYQLAPFVIYMMGGVAALYVPALLLIRRPRVTVSENFVIDGKAPNTVDTRSLVSAASSALVYFLLLCIGILVWGGR